MMRQIIGRKKKKAIFICSITENYLKVIKCRLHNSKRRFVALEEEALSLDIDDKKLSERLGVCLKKLEYDNHPLIISLPRNHATSRYIRVPTQVPEEIQRIVFLQASRYLPYPSDELITGYQIISSDKEGFSNVNLIIVHKDAIARYLSLLRELRIKNFIIVLSSYGIVNLYNQIKQNEDSPVLVIDVDADSVELVIVSNKKGIFSRYFKLYRLRPDFEELFIEEINKTQDLYLKEPGMEAPQKIVVLGAGKVLEELAPALNRQKALPVELLFYPEKINLSESLLNSILSSKVSFATLVGLGIEEIEESLYLMPQEVKAEMRMGSQRKENLRLIFLIFAVIVAWVAGLIKTLDNKAAYLERIKRELNKISQEAMSLEEIEKRVTFLEGRAQQEISSLDALYQVHKVIPPQISLLNFNYEEDSHIITMRGEAVELETVFKFVSILGKSPVFDNFNVKVRYATNKKTQTGELVDFEIVCSKK